MKSKKVFVSYDHEVDARCRLLIEAWDESPEYAFRFGELATEHLARAATEELKGRLARDVAAAKYTLVIVGSGANRRHKDANVIGYLNWQHFVIAKSKERGNRLIGAKLDPANVAPGGLLDANTTWAVSFDRDAVLDALRAA